MLLLCLSFAAIRAFAASRAPFAFADANGDSQISLKELQDYVTPRVTRDAHKAARTQTPTLQLGPALTDPNHVIVSWGVTAPQ